jgi:integrase
MARELHRLSATAVKAMTKPGRHSDGGGLVLHVDDENRRRWVFRYRWGPKVRDMGLGPYPAVSLADAREAAAEARKLLAKDIDPLAERAKAKADAVSKTFGEVADELIAARRPGWKNSKHVAQWVMTLDEYAKPIRAKPVNEITTADILGVLQPLWLRAPETASRLRGRLEAVLDFAKTRGWRQGDNPALWRGHLSHLLADPKKVKGPHSRGHHKALPYPEVPAFVKTLRANGSASAMALEFLILTASRTGEVIGARWDEFDLEERIWSVPADRMKGGKLHRVPLSGRAMEILETMRQAGGTGYVFPSSRKVRKGEEPGPLSEMAMAMLVRRAKLDATPHGFRSSFRDWTAEATTFPSEVAEMALAHVIGNRVEAAYRRGDLMQKRRAMMDQWAAFVDAPPAGNVVPMARAEG